ncbi:MAG: hypothetical protein ACE5FL_06185 [Myxococcota bacterium]
MQIKAWAGAALAALLVFGNVACREEGAAEKMGKALDQAAADAADAAEEAKEKMKEAME